MSNPVTPAEQQKTAVKVKYSTKAKRKRNITENTESGEESELHESDMSGEIRRTKSPQVAPKTPEAKSGPKIVDVHLPGPSPKRPVQDVEEGSSKPASKAKHSAKPPSTSVHQSSPSSKPPSSAAKPPSTRQPEGLDDDADETSSIAESASGTRIRRSEPERIQYFKDQPECGELEPNRVFCSRCQSWVNLGKQRTYTVRPWEMHRAKCDRKPSVVKEIEQEAHEPILLEKPIQPENEEVVGSDVDEEKPDVASPPASASNRDTSSPSSTRTRRSESERCAILQADPRAQEVKPHEVLCRSCQKWIKLSTGAMYNLYNWQQHQSSCSGTAPSSRVATAERKIVLLNDPQVKACSPQSVKCAFCKSTVELQGAVDYDLTKWNEHKTSCTSTIVQMTPRVPASRISRVFPPPSSASTTSQTPSSITARPLASSGSISTEATAIADSPPTKIGVKRGREEDSEETASDRPSNRSRGEGYQPPEGKALGPWGWVMQPLRSFIRGFREGLGTPFPT